jgi:hypothetical protein
LPTLQHRYYDTQVSSLEPFTIAVPDTVLHDLQLRLAATRWQYEVAGVEWDQDTNLDYLRSLVAYWRTGDDWRIQEPQLNQCAQFHTEVAGLKVHYVHEHGHGPAPMPLILTHGWPSSFVEYLDLIPLLTDPASHGGDVADAFDVVVPSLRATGSLSGQLRRAWSTQWSPTCGPS